MIIPNKYFVEDYNECNVNPNVCGDPSAAVCINSAGSYNCRCNPGYKISDRKCIGRYSANVDFCYSVLVGIALMLISVYIKCV